MQKYNNSVNLDCTIEEAYDKAISAVQVDSSTGVWFGTTVRESLRCFLSLTLLGIIQRIVADPSIEHDEKVSVGSRNITNL